MSTRALGRKQEIIMGHTLGLVVMLALGILLAPLAAAAQPAGKVYRIGVLETTSAALNIPNLDAFRHGLRELGVR
jgi:hypothetical protein